MKIDTFIAVIIEAVLLATAIICLIAQNGCKNRDIGWLNEDLKRATNEVQTLRGQLVSAGTNYTSLHGQALAIEGERDSLAVQVKLLRGNTNTLAGQIAILQGEKSALEADKASLTSEAAKLLTEKNTLTLQVTTLEREKTGLTIQVGALEGDKKILTAQVQTLEAANAALAKQLAVLTNATTKTRASTGGTPTHIIQTPGTGIGSAKSSFTTNGVAGGVPALFVNKAEQAVVITVRGNGVTFTLDLKARTGVKRFDIMPGEYSYNYTVGDDPTLLPETGSATFTVDKESSHYLEGYGAFNGGAIFRGRQ